MNIQIVNEADEIIGEKKKNSITDQDIFRVSSLWIYKSQGQVLLAQRSKSKKNHPGKWSPTVEGTLASGEQYDTKICKRTYEELGIQISKKDLRVGKKIRITSPYNHFNQNFSITLDTLDIEKDMVINEKEIEKIAWFRVQDLEQEIEKHPENFVGSLKAFL